MPDDGYPTDEELDQIEKYFVNGYEACECLCKLAADLWHWPEFASRNETGLWTFVTGGWSGNESIITSLHRNTMFWMLYWQSSERGGRHRFGKIEAYNE